MERKRKRSRSRVVLVLAVLGVLVVLGVVSRKLPLPMLPGASGPGSGVSAVPEDVQVAVAEDGSVKQRISSTGEVSAQTGALVKIGSQITGRIKSLPADVGTQVRPNQVVAVLDAPDLEAQVSQQRHNASAAAASVVQAESRLRQKLENAGFTRAQTEAQITEARAAMDASQSKVESAQASATLQPAQTRAEIERAKASLAAAETTLRQAEQTAAQQVQQAQSTIDETQASAENAQQSLTRYEQLLKEGFAAAQDVDNYRSSYKQASAKLVSSRANLLVVKEKTRADVDTAREQVRQARASLDAAQASTLQDAVKQADLRSAQQSLRQARATLDLRKANASEDRITAMEVSEARGALQQAQANLRQSQSQLQYQLAQLDKAVIHSPIGGTVLSIAAQQGETVAAGLAAPTLITVADLNRLQVTAYVDETDIGRVRLGLPAEVRVDSFPERVFHGRVSKISSSSTIKDNVVTYQTTIALTDGNGLLRPDMTADVGIILGVREHLVLVPSEAIHREPERTVVYVLHRDRPDSQRVETRVVNSGVDDGKRTEVRSGLKAGEEVVLAGLQRLGVRAPDAQGGGPPGPGGRR